MTMGRVMDVTRPEVLNDLATRRAWFQVKTKYASRWKQQVNTESYWQQAKRAANDGKGRLPLGSGPGFLTGTTFQAIKSSVSPVEGVVGLEGTWPIGDGCVQGGDSMFKWGSNSGLEYFIHHGYAAASGAYDPEKGRPGSGGFTYIPRQNIADMKYLGDVDWMYLDSQDIDLITRDIETVINSRITGDARVSQRVYDSIYFKNEKLPVIPQRTGKATEGIMADVGSLEQVVKMSGKSERELMALLGVGSPSEILDALELKQEAVRNARNAAYFFGSED